MTNGSTDYKLGELDSKFNSLHERFNTLERKVDGLNTWRWKVVGSTSILAAIVGFLASKFF